MGVLQDGVPYTENTIDDVSAALATRNTSAASGSSNSSGGWLAFKKVSANNTNSTLVKGSAGAVGSIQLIGNSATVHYVKLYDKATAPTVGTDVPVKTFVVPANSTSGAGSNVSIPNGLTFSNGIGIGITTGLADTDTGAATASAVVVNLEYR